MILSFFIGTTISSLPFIFHFLESFKNEKLLYKEMIIEQRKIENICKNSDSQYAKLLNLGFQNSAIDKYNECIKKYAYKNK